MKVPILGRTLPSLALLLLAGCAAAAGGNPWAEGGPGGPYDNHAFLVDSRRMALEPIFDSIVRLHTESLFRLEDGEQVTVRNEGTGLVLKGGYILTLDHVVSHYALEYLTPFGRVERPAAKLSDATFLLWEGKKLRLEALHKDRSDDIALFRAPESLPLKSFPYAIGNSDDLRVGNFIYVVGNPLNFGLNVREGIVSSLRAPRVLERVEARAENAFMVSNGLNPGDSGSPVIAIRGGRFELVGLSQGTFVASQRIGWVIRINAIRKELGKVNVRLEAEGFVPRSVPEERGYVPPWKHLTTH